MSETYQYAVVDLFFYFLETRSCADYKFLFNEIILYIDGFTLIYIFYTFHYNILYVILFNYTFHNI